MREAVRYKEHREHWKSMWSENMRKYSDEANNKTRRLTLRIDRLRERQAYCDDDALLTSYMYIIIYIGDIRESRFALRLSHWLADWLAPQCNTYIHAWYGRTRVHAIPMPVYLFIYLYRNIYIVYMVYIIWSVCCMFRSVSFSLVRTPILALAIVYSTP